VFAGYPNREPVLFDVALRLDQGAVTAILGPNGAGKSTLVKVLTGLLPPQRGAVNLFGRDMRSLSRREIARHIAVVPQTVQIAFDFRVRDVVMMGRAPQQGSMLVASEQDRRIVEQVLERTDLAQLSDRKVSELSGGEQMRVAIARALAQQPDVLVLDEATAHLDIRHSLTLHALVRREVQERGLVCVAVLHELNEAAQNADHVVLLQKGRVIAQGDIPTVMTWRLLRETYGVDLYVGVNELDGTRYFVPIRQSPGGA
jgi:iron complex transport system ATP-binding protein